MTKIETVRDVVVSFGGTGKTADFLKIVPSAVSNMLSAREIPRAYHLEILAELENRGHQVDVELLFGVHWDRNKKQFQPCQKKGGHSDQVTA